MWLDRINELGQNEYVEDVELLIVIVAAPPSITEFSDDQYVMPGENVTLYCRATGHPTQPTLQWFKRDDNSGQLKGALALIFNCDHLLFI